MWLRVAIRYSVSRVVPPYRVHELMDVPMAPEWEEVSETLVASNFVVFSSQIFARHGYFTEHDAILIFTSILLYYIL